MAKETGLKIAVVASSAPPFSSGGVATAHYNLFRSLQRAGFNAHMFTFGDDGHKGAKDIVRSGTPKWFLKFTRVANQLIFGLFDFRKKAYQTRDIIASLWGARRMSKNIFAYKPDVIILSDHGAPGLLLRKPQGCKVILISHHNPLRFVGSRFPGFSERDAKWAIYLEQTVLKKADAVVCPTSYMKKWFERTYEFDGPKYVIHNIVDSDTIASVRSSKIRSKMGLQDSDVLIYMPSAANRLKGGPHVLNIISRLTGLFNKVAFYIPGDLPTDLKNQYLRLFPRPRVFWGEQLPYIQNLANVKACSFGISPSLLENYSMALLEAVQVGVPMLAYDIGGNSEIIRNGQNGYLVPEGDIDALVAKAAQFLKADRLIALRKKTLAYAKKQNLRAAFDAYRKLIRTL